MTIVETSSATIPQFNLPWIDSPFFEQLLAESDLDAPSKKFVKNYAEQGYAIANLEIPDFDELVDEIIRILPQGRDIIKYTDRVQNAWLFNEAVRKLAISPQILSILKTLYQREPIPFQTLNFWKDEGLVDFLKTPRQKLREVSPFLANIIYHLGIWKKKIRIKL